MTDTTLSSKITPGSAEGDLETIDQDLRAKEATLTKPIPNGYHTLTPAAVYKDARKAIDFYKQAFGAKEVEVIPGANGRGVMHADLLIGDSHFMLGDENPQQPRRSAEASGANAVSFCLYVQDVDQAFQQAVNAGAKPEMPIADMFWGDRMGSVLDPFGQTWDLLTHVRDVPKEEIEKGARKAREAMAGQKS
jgi:PhnB protein